MSHAECLPSQQILDILWGVIYCAMHVVTSSLPSNEHLMTKGDAQSDILGVYRCQMIINVLLLV